MAVCCEKLSRVRAAPKICPWNAARSLLTQQVTILNHCECLLPTRPLRSTTMDHPDVETIDDQTAKPWICRFTSVKHRVYGEKQRRGARVMEESEIGAAMAAAKDNRMTDESRHLLMAMSFCQTNQRSVAQKVNKQRHFSPKRTTKRARTRGENEGRAAGCPPGPDAKKPRIREHIEFPVDVPLVKVLRLRSRTVLNYVPGTSFKEKMKSTGSREHRSASPPPHCVSPLASSARTKSAELRVKLDRVKVPRSPPLLFPTPPNTSPEASCSTEEFDNEQESLLSHADGGDNVKSDAYLTSMCRPVIVCINKIDSADCPWLPDDASHGVCESFGVSAANKHDDEIQERAVFTTARSSTSSSVTSSDAETCSTPITPMSVCDGSADVVHSSIGAPQSAHKTPARRLEDVNIENGLVAVKHDLPFFVFRGEKNNKGCRASCCNPPPKSKISTHRALTLLPAKSKGNTFVLGKNQTAKYLIRMTPHGDWSYEEVEFDSGRRHRSGDRVTVPAAESERF